MPTRAVLFDFDGVLADSENVHVAAWQRTFRAMGWNEADETCARAIATDDRSFVREVLARRKIDGGDVAGWAQRKQDLTLQLLRDRPRLRSGAAELVQTLKEVGATLGVVTTSPRAHVETVLAASGLLDAFDILITGDDVANFKPDPEPYRLAVERLGIEPGDAVALEDSAPGLSAAEGAGVRVVAVVAARSPGEWAASAAARVADLTDPALVLAALGL